MESVKNCGQLGLATTIMARVIGKRNTEILAYKREIGIEMY